MEAAEGDGRLCFSTRGAAAALGGVVAHFAPDVRAVEPVVVSRQCCGARQAGMDVCRAALMMGAVSPALAQFNQRHQHHLRH